MKNRGSVITKRILASFASLGLIVGLTAGEISFSRLPPSVQKTVNANLNGGVVQEIDRKINEGRALYRVGIRREGLRQQLLLDVNGRLLRSGNIGDANPDQD